MLQKYYLEMSMKIVNNDKTKLGNRFSALGRACN